MATREEAENYLKIILNDTNASFRDGQWESIAGLLANQRLLVVQRTGWGKSMVYFLATRLLRNAGKGPTLLVSPLLSLMRNQIEAAQRIGIRASTINSTNKDEWETAYADFQENRVDILLISPERLGNDDFRNRIFSNGTENIGLFVIDEAHCISDWGHDFRPDYRRIVRVLRNMPQNIPVLATTATANNRVVEDIQSQMGSGINLQRGPLIRESLSLQNIQIPSPAARMAWLAKTIPSLPKSGIVYTLTQRDSELVAEWLSQNHIAAKAYHAGVSSETGPARETLEQQLLNNEIKVLVATVALGMGFDKPDLGFVIHFQRPASVVHYYQQVGRAGRAINQAYGILLCGEEDDNIADYFIKTAFPPQKHIEEVLFSLKRSNNGLSVSEMQAEMNLKESQIRKTLAYLLLESPSPIIKEETKYQVTATAENYVMDKEHIERIINIRRSEQNQMREYMNHTGCLMQFLQTALDDPTNQNCNKCRNCCQEGSLPESCDKDLINKAGIFLRRNYHCIKPRAEWPRKSMFEHYTQIGSTLRIPKELRAQEGRALSFWNDAGWGKLVADGKYRDNRFSDDLVTGCQSMMESWGPSPSPMWVTCIPSLTRPELVQSFSERLACALKLPFYPCIGKQVHNKEQKEMQNSYQQVKNLDGVFEIKHPILLEPCLLVDDVVDSKWTMTIAAALLRQAGCPAVYPLALALNSSGTD